MEKECYEEDVQPYRKTNNKPVIIIIVIFNEKLLLVKGKSFRVEGCNWFPSIFYFLLDFYVRTVTCKNIVSLSSH